MLDNVAVDRAERHDRVALIVLAHVDDDPLVAVSLHDVPDPRPSRRQSKLGSQREETERDGYCRGVAIWHNPSLSASTWRNGSGSEQSRREERLLKSSPKPPQRSLATAERIRRHELAQVVLGTVEIRRRLDR